MSPDSPELAGRLAQFGLALLQVSAFADAEPMLRECLAIREKAAPDDWRTFNTKSMLGGALLGQAKQLQATDAAAATAKLTEAEPLLVQGYEGMQQREATIPPEGKIRLTEALQRLVDLYTAWGKPDEAAKWQEKLDALKGAAKPRARRTECDVMDVVQPGDTSGLSSVPRSHTTKTAGERHNQIANSPATA